MWKHSKNKAGKHTNKQQQQQKKYRQDPEENKCGIRIFPSNSQGVNTANRIIIFLGNSAVHGYDKDCSPSRASAVSSLLWNIP